MESSGPAPGTNTAIWFPFSKISLLSAVIIISPPLLACGAYSTASSKTRFTWWNSMWDASSIASVHASTTKTYIIIKPSQRSHNFSFPPHEDPYFRSNRLVDQFKGKDTCCHLSFLALSIKCLPFNANWLLDWFNLCSCAQNNRGTSDPLHIVLWFYQYLVPGPWTWYLVPGTRYRWFECSCVVGFLRMYIPYSGVPASCGHFAFINNLISDKES